jgi:4-diphosphocytidyl-2-C-methyl-D-erythritol kinase
MHAYSLIAPAKINLYLEILGDRPDGYHELAMVLQSIALADQIDLRPNGTDRFRIHCDHPKVPADKTNLAYRAAVLMSESFPQVFYKFGGLDISIQKHIPVGAGLAGGSTNAAAVLVGIDLMWGLGLTQPELQELGAKLGSDVPFCIEGGTAIATGRGEQLSALAGQDQLYVLLAKYRSLSVSTAWAYQTYRQQFGASYISECDCLEGRRREVHSGPIVSAICHRDFKQVGKLLYNDLEKVVLPHYPQVAELRDQMQKLGALGAMMSGSGPTLFALTHSQAQAQTMQEEIRSRFPDPDLELWVTRCIASGVQLVH